MSIKISNIALTLLILSVSSVGNTQIDYKKEAERCFIAFQDIEYVDLPQARIYVDSAMFYANMSGDDEYIGRAHQYKGWHLQDISRFKEARTEFYRSLASFKKAKNEQRIADAYGNLGNAYLDMDLYQKSLEYQMKSLTANEKILLDVKGKVDLERAEEGKTYALHNLAAIYTDIGFHDRALEYQLISLSDEVRSGNKKGEAISCNAIAISYKNLNIVDSATLFFERAIRIYNSLENVAGLASTYFSYATLQGSSLSSSNKKRMIMKSLKMHKENGDIDSYVHQLLSIGRTNFEQISNDSVSYILNEANKGIVDFELVHHRLDYHELEAKYLARIGDHESAYSSLQEYLKLKLIIDEEKKSRELILGGLRREMQMKAYNDSLVLTNEYNIQSAVDQKKIADQRSWIVLGVFAGLVLVATLFYVVNSNRRRKRLNDVLSGKNQAIQEKNDIIEEHNQSVAASIQYAKRLQTAILPTREEVNHYLPNSFLIFRPKDVVSGDFYWFEVVNDIIYIAVADCTGHGVPGAMVSVVCSNALHRVLNEFHITSPSKILTKARELVIATFARSDNKVVDGMDISLCAINLKEHFIDFAGANNALWIVRKNDLLSNHSADKIHEGTKISLLEYKANKQPVGSYPDMRDFTEKRIPLMRDDQLYLFSDGYADQFGGEQGKKFKSACLKEEILSGASYPMKRQGEVLSSLFDEWKGELEQVDDVCIIGVKL